MTKQELIESYSETVSNSLSATSILVILGVLLIVAIVAYFIVSEGEVEPSILLLIAIVGFFMILILPFIEERDSKYMTQEEWVTNVFEKEYLPEVPVYRTAVNHKEMNEDGTFTVRVPGSVVKDISRVIYEDRDRAILEGKYVEHLSDYGIEDGYYDVVLHLPQEEE